MEGQSYQCTNCDLWTEADNWAGNEAVPVCPECHAPNVAGKRDKGYRVINLTLFHCVNGDTASVLEINDDVAPTPRHERVLLIELLTSVEDYLAKTKTAAQQEAV